MDIYLLVALVTSELVLSGVTDSVAQDGFCQVYSYNIRVRETGREERHLFVCCNNMQEKSCRGLTYQKPQRSESFCTGQVMIAPGNHWTQMETSQFPDSGRTYCGGCCGQHIAWETCTQQSRENRHQECVNWVQCFFRECRKVIASVMANRPLKCSFPPAPHPKHFIHEPRTLPVNVSLEFSSPRTPSGHSLSSSNQPQFTCSASECKALDMDARCRLTCCEDYCCLPDGPLETAEERRRLFGMTPGQLTGLVVGILASIVVITGCGVLVARKCVPACKNLRHSNHDTQILVIEEPDEMDDSDDPDSV